MTGATRAGHRKRAVGSAGCRLRFEDRGDRWRRDSEMRGMPSDLAFLQDEQLRRLVADAKPRRDIVRETSIGLHRDDPSVHGSRLEGCGQLFERFRADAAPRAVLEEQHEAFAIIDRGLAETDRAVQG